jgi:hypothetical protein
VAAAAQFSLRQGDERPVGVEILDRSAFIRCIDVIKAVNGYDRRGRLVSHDVWSR